MSLSLTIRYLRDEEGWWVAEIPEIPGAFSQGRTKEEAREMVLDAANELAIARRQKLEHEAFDSTEEIKLLV